MIGTGGTIASEMTEAGLVPGMSGAEFLQYIPSVEKLCQVDCLQVCNIDSTNMTPSHWLAIAQAVETHYETYDGFVICHGTDTLAYTAAALSYLIQDSPKPIVLTGSQKPIHMDITDSKTNLLDSFTVCLEQTSRFSARKSGDNVNIYEPIKFFRSRHSSNSGILNKRNPPRSYLRTNSATSPSSWNSVTRIIFVVPNRFSFLFRLRTSCDMQRSQEGNCMRANSFDESAE